MVYLETLSIFQNGPLILLLASLSATSAHSLIQFSYKTACVKFCEKPKKIKLDSVWIDSRFVIRGMEILFGKKLKMLPI